MNLIDIYIDEIISETEVLIMHEKFYKVEMIIDEYGNKRKAKMLFGKDEWNKAKKDGKFLG